MISILLQCPICGFIVIVTMQPNQRVLPLRCSGGIGEDAPHDVTVLRVVGVNWPNRQLVAAINGVPRI